MLNLFERAFFYLLLALLISACGASKKLTSVEKNNSLFREQQAENHFVGLLVVDPVSKDTLYAINSKKYFIPASTTKIVTLYTALKLLPERIPSLKYIAQNDTLYFEGTGDPTQLHPHFKDSTVIRFLHKQKNLVWHPNNYQGELLGPGWAWEDYQYYYQVERGALPLYGNVAQLYQLNGLQVFPDYFKNSVIDLNYPKNREIEANTFYYDSERRDTIAIPFRTDSTLTKKLLEASVQKPIISKKAMPEGEKSVVFSIPSDSVYKRMMHESDNFLADQLLVLSSGMLSDTLDGKKARTYILENELADLKQPPRWVDGSGLSRYNLFTPESMVQVLNKLRKEIPQKRLFEFFVPNAISDTITNQKVPYIYAKSGSVGNNYSLNGYLLTQSGKLLNFSFMNNHFTVPSSVVREQVQDVLKQIHQAH